MSALPTDTGDGTDHDASQSDAMKDQLRGDVASWMAARAETADRSVPGSSVPAMRTPAPKPAARARSAKPASAAAQSGAVKKKPFGMSYDGMSQADYITYMISRGAR